MKQQLEALRRMNGRKGYGLLMEQGTGKTWTLLADAERLYATGAIDALLVIAPKGVHTNWVRREIPAHMDVPHIARAWRSGAGKRELARLEELFSPRELGEQNPMRIFAINIDALNTGPGLKFAQRFLRATRAMIVVDESSRIKTPNSRRTQAVMALRQLAEYARIATGTPITNAPMDIFAQLEFLESGLLGTTSFRSFTAEYAELVDLTDVTDEDYFRNSRMLKNNPRLAHAQLVKKDADGAPRWRNLDKLQRLLEPHTYRVLKRDCLDLPEKIFQTHYFELEPQQQRAYALMQEEHRVELVEGEILSVSKLAAIGKLQQITSGFVLQEDNEPHYVSEGNPRLSALLDVIEDAPGKVIVWAKFKEELRAIAAALRADKHEVVEYHGGIGREDRELAVDAFQHGTARVFVGQPRSGGIGLTLTAAESVIYYSNEYSLETRLQSEDRAHRIGTTRHVVYTDLVATDTIDERIAAVLQRKASVAATILGDGKVLQNNSAIIASI